MAAAWFSFGEIALNVGNSVREAIVDWEAGELEASMLHACNAVDGTAKKLYGNLGANARFTELLRANYSILGPMGVPGINLAETRFPIVVARPKASGGQPDLADVIYGIHRCCHGHGEELPGGFELLQDAAASTRVTRLSVVKGAVRLSDRIIFGLLAVAVCSPVNIDQVVPDGFYLTFGDSEKLFINQWWGRAGDFSSLVARDPMPSVKMDFGDWMS